MYIRETDLSSPRLAAPNLSTCHFSILARPRQGTPEAPHSFADAMYDMHELNLERVHPYYI